MNFILVGIVRDATSSLAMLQPANGQKVLSLRAGQALDGWTLVSIGIDSASFRNGAAEQALTLDFRRAAPPPPAPPRPDPSPALLLQGIYSFPVSVPKGSGLAFLQGICSPERLGMPSAPELSVYVKSVNVNTLGQAIVSGWSAFASRDAMRDYDDTDRGLPT